VHVQFLTFSLNYNNELKESLSLTSGICKSLSICHLAMITHLKLCRFLMEN